jgi:hypothetical protein
MTASERQRPAGPYPTLGELALSRALGAVRLLGGVRGSREHRAAILSSVLRRLLEAAAACEQELRRLAA